MASTNKTANLSLNQWVPTDPVLMEDMNEDNRKLDAAVCSITTQISGKGNCNIQSGSYVGNGLAGTSAPNSLTFAFIPRVVIFSDKAVSNETCVYVSGVSTMTLNAPVDDYCLCQLSGKTLTWYCMNSKPQFQLNSSDHTYYWVALG